MRKVYYYTIENCDGHIYTATIERKEAKNLCQGFSETGICYKRKVGDKSYRKFCFMW